MDQSHCSALIRLLPNNKDLFISQVSFQKSLTSLFHFFETHLHLPSFSQDTWSSFNTMTRIMKLYDLSYLLAEGDGRRLAGERIAFSSYPGRSVSDCPRLLGRSWPLVLTLP